VAKQAKVRSPKKPRIRRPPAWNMEAQCERIMGGIRKAAARCPIETRRQFCRWIAERIAP
jgi:hypothetical protein